MAGCVFWKLDRFPTLQRIILPSPVYKQVRADMHVPFIDGSENGPNANGLAPFEWRELVNQNTPDCIGYFGNIYICEMRSLALHA